MTCPHCTYLMDKNRIMEQDVERIKARNFVLLLRLEKAIEDYLRNHGDGRCGTPTIQVKENAMRKL